VPAGIGYGAAQVDTEHVRAAMAVWRFVFPANTFMFTSVWLNQPRRLSRHPGVRYRQAPPRTADGGATVFCGEALARTSQR
jgi:hypothetical protein